MSDDVKHILSELEGTQDNQDDDVSTDDAKISDGSDQDGKVTEEAKEKARQETVKNQAAAWAIKLVQKGQTVDDLPEAQAYLKPHIEALLGAAKKETVEEVKARPKPEMTTRDAVKYELLLEKVGQLELATEDAKALVARQKKERDKGLNPLQALEEALDYCRIDLAPTSKKVDAVKVSEGAKADSGLEEYRSDFSPKELAQWRENLRKKRAGK